MKNLVNSFLFALAISTATFFAGGSALAADKMRGVQNVLASQATAEARNKVPASYRITQDETRKPATMDGASMYYGGAIRTLIVDGQPVRLSEREVIENIRAGRFIVVNTESGNRLSRDDWEISLPYWLGRATREVAGQ